MNELDDKLKQAKLKYVKNSPIFLTEFEERVFEHAFRLGYYNGKEDGIKEGVKEILHEHASDEGDDLNG